MEPEVYEKLKHEAPDKKVLPDLYQKMQEIWQSNRPDSEKVTLYNKTLQKLKLFLKKIQPKIPVKNSLSENALLKRYKNVSKWKNYSTKQKAKRTQTGMRTVKWC